MFTAMENGYRHLPITYVPFASSPCTEQAFSSLKRPGKSCGTRCVSCKNGVLVSIIYKKNYINVAHFDIWGTAKQFHCQAG